MEVREEKKIDEISTQEVSEINVVILFSQSFSQIKTKKKDALHLKTFFI